MSAEDIGGVRRRVVKLGGSLLAGADCVDRLQRWLAVEPGWATLLMVGGGTTVDELRMADRSKPLAVEPALPSLSRDEMDHWLSIAAMDVHAQALARAAHWPIGEWSAWRCSPAAYVTVLDVWNFLRSCEPREPPPALPIGWQVTSDSIAARVAALSNSELTLLKSRLPTPPQTLAHWSAQGYVDEYFPISAANLTAVRAVDWATGQAVVVVTD